MQEMWVQTLGWENILEEEMATHSSILDWKIPETEEPGGLQSKGSQKVGCSWALSIAFLNQLYLVLKSFIALLKNHDFSLKLEYLMDD